MAFFKDNVESAQGYVPGFQPKDTDVVKLNTNENPYPPSPQVIEAIKDLPVESLRRYPDPLGNKFRQAAAELFNLKPDNIICCNGGDDLLRIAIQAFCDQDRLLAYSVPTYSLYPVLGKLLDCKTIEIPFGKVLDLPAELTRTNAALTILCNPNAPTASFIDVEKIASLANALNGVLLIDEAYVDFAEDNCVSIVKEFDNVIILRSMSKGYSLAGLRFGYGIAQPDLIEGLMKVKDSYNVNALAIAAATAAVKDQDYFKQTVEKIRSQRQILTSQLRELNFEVPDSAANFVLAKCKDCKAQEIYDKLVKRNIYVRFFNIPDLNNKLRITVGTAEQNKMLIEALKEIIQG
ncbi:MAG: histidinol-phosphate transaminase [Planctomycetota bacterium]|jgi:histidinol-phosphate aminotransferase